MRSRNTRGIVLVSVMILSILIGMYILAASVLSRGQVGVVRKNTDNRMAEEAARSGLEYALARLEENSSWRGSLDRVTVDTPELMVVEESGNVVGLITTPDGGQAQFRLRFNCQDGTGGLDGASDPTPGMMIDNPHISVNNLDGVAHADLYMGDGPNNSPNSLLEYDLPAGVAAIVVEGRVGEGLAAASSTNPNPVIGRAKATRTIEAFYRISGGDALGTVPNAVSMAGRNFRAELFDGDGTNPKKVELLDVRTNGLARIRARDGISVTDADTGNAGEVDGANAELRVPTSGTLTANMVGGVSAADEDTNNAFYQLEWDQVDMPDGASGSLQGGVYAVNDSGQLTYFDMSFEDYQSYIQTNPNDEGSQGSPINLDGSNGVRFVAMGEDYNGEPSDRHRFVVTDDVLVEGSSSGVEDLTITPEKGAKEDIDDDQGGGGGGDWSYSFPSVGSDAARVSQLQGAFCNNPSHGHYSSKIGLPTGYISNPTSMNPPPEAFEFFRQLSDKGQIVASNGDFVKWEDAFFEVQGNGRDAWDEFTSGQTVLENHSDTQNPAFVSFADNLDILSFYDAVSSGGGSGEGFAETASTDTTTVENVEVTFDPQNSEGARLGSNGDIRIAADVRGEGASMKAAGQIRLIGMGFDIDAASGEEGPGVSLYAQDDIVISTLKPDGAGDYYYSGMELKGLLYSWKDIELKTGHAQEVNSNPQRVFVQGAMVAYGGDPADPSGPGNGQGGNITVRGDHVQLLFDPAYLLGLSGLNGAPVDLELLSRNFR